MLRREGFPYTKTDYYEATFELKDGDIIFYDTNKRSTDDYRVIKGIGPVPLFY
ncbi:hypothetical protein EPD62_004465 [Acetivibrio thermocellus]|uniref:hypothetical protein n=1 Tax=Acetivibrio thermocellus TaxID=1515 RepID=UPI0002F7CD5C|nr:hypothetical protein [Acetivibrio thermocellus]